MENGKIKLNIGSKSKAKSSVNYTGKDEKIRDKILSKITNTNDKNERRNYIMAKIKYQVRFGIKLNNDDNQAGTFGKPEYFTTIVEAKDEVNRIFNSEIKGIFPDAKCGELVMVTDLKCDCGGNISSATYEDGTELFGRMDGVFEDGEFYVEIIKGKIVNE